MAWATAGLCAVGVALAAPEWVPRAWTAEDGVIETAQFACFLVAALLALAVARRLRPSTGAMLAAAGLGLLLLAVAGEEVSWGQRWLAVETPAVLVDGNRQDELNLHNLEGVQDKAVYGQLALAAAGAALPWIVRRPWGRVGAPFFAAYLAYRGARGIAWLVDSGRAGDNAEVAELLLAAGLLALTAQLFTEYGRAPAPIRTEAVPRSPVRPGDWAGGPVEQPVHRRTR